MVEVELSGDELRAALAEDVLGWKRVMLWEHDLNPEFLRTGHGPIYTDGTKQYRYLVPLDWTPTETGVFGQIGDLRIGGRLPELDWAGMELVIERFWSVSLEKCDSVDPPWHACVWSRQGDGEPYAEGRGHDAPTAVARAAVAAKRAEGQ